MSMQARFNEFASALEITCNEQKDASALHTDVRQRLDGSSLEIERDFLSGSYARETKIRPLKDIDLVMILEEDAYPGYDDDSDPAALLDEVKDVLDELYEDDDTVTIEMQHRSVNLTFTDPPYGFDVVPAFVVDGDVLRIPDRKHDMWPRTNPAKHRELLTNANNEQHTDGTIVPIIKMLKAWNTNQGGLVKSFWIEAQTMQIFTSKIESYPKGVSAFFHRAADLILDPCPEPAGVGPDIDISLTDEERRVKRERFLGFAGLADQALQYEADGDEDEAHRLWYEIFGNPFPKPPAGKSGAGSRVSFPGGSRTTPREAEPFA